MPRQRPQRPPVRDAEEALRTLKRMWDAGADLIPLHRWDLVKKYGGKDMRMGKVPSAGRRWQAAEHSWSDVETAISEGANVGCRLSNRVVLDVDPRNMPEDSDAPAGVLVGDVAAPAGRRNTFSALCDVMRTSPEDVLRRCFVVATGGGGVHVYLKHDGGLTRGAVPDFPGIELKAPRLRAGAVRLQQVVAPGSIHPDTVEAYYVVDEVFGVGFDETARVADFHGLDELVSRRDGRADGLEGDAEGPAAEVAYESGEIAKALDAVDAVAFRGRHDDWLAIMAEVYHSSGGLALEEWIAWCVSDPVYADDEEEIRYRWGTLGQPGADGVRGYRSLDWRLRNMGRSDLIPGEVTNPAADFDDNLEDAPDQRPAADRTDPAGATPPEPLLGPAGAGKSLLQRMNDRYCVVDEGGKFFVYYDHVDPVEGRVEWRSADQPNFMRLLAHKWVQDGDKEIPLAKKWLTWPQRRQMQGVVFDPEKDHKYHLNLWRGWGVKPLAGGDWGLLKELLHDVLCDREDVAYEYVMNWMAYLVQRPWELPEVAVAFHGRKGVGKGTLGRALVALAGRHGRQIISPRSLLGRFNAHLRDTIFLFVDEAIATEDKAGQARMRGLITESYGEYEPKGREIVTDRNRLHIMLASNESWVVNASPDERRFFVAHVNDSRQRDLAFFRRVNEQLYRKGGLGGMLAELKDHDIAGWHPRDSIPKTEALVDQIILSLGPTQRWWYGALVDAALPFDAGEDEDWDTGPVRAMRQDVVDAFHDYLRQGGQRMQAPSDRDFAKELEQCCPNIKGLKSRTDKVLLSPGGRPDVTSRRRDGRVRGYVFPSLPQCRAMFEAFIDKTGLF